MNTSEDLLLSIDGRQEHLVQWNHLQTAWLSQRLPQSMLFVSSFRCTFIDFVKKLTQLIFCKKQENAPCFACIDCQMVARGEHPDVTLVKPEKTGGPVKIDQIRELQNYAYLTPQRAQYRLIVIQSADQMNGAAANSLLKILEEPAEHTLFLLLAQQLSTVLPTVLSRCQIIRFASLDNASPVNFLQFAEHYSAESEQALIVKQAEFILDGLIAVIENKEHPSVVAAQWSQFELNVLLWFLYLVYAQIQMHLSTPIFHAPTSDKLKHLMSLLNPLMIFIQLDKINILKRKLSHNMHVNQTLVVEDLLLALIQ